MATRGFEFAYDLNGSNATPVIRDMILGVAAAHEIGDLMVIQADGFIDAARDLVKQCDAAGVPVFVKQIPINGKVSKDINQFPKELQIREFPKQVT